jgi:hypothetical protein
MGAITSSDGTSGHWVPSERYPDPSVQVLDSSFAKYRLLLAGIERLATAGARGRSISAMRAAVLVCRSTAIA